MFKNLLIYRINPEWQPSGLSLIAAEAELSRQRFQPCAPSQPSSCGWVEPCGMAYSPLVERVAGQWHLRLKTETKLLPAAVVKRRADEMAAAIEKETGRKPARKQLKTLREEATLELLPKAFTREGVVRVWISPDDRWLALDCTSAARAEDAVTLLVKALPGFAITPIQTQAAPSDAMAMWLSDGEAPQGFTVDQDCELKEAADKKGGVRYVGQDLGAKEVQEHLHAGKKPTRLTLTWKGRVSFVLTETLQLKRLNFDVVSARSTTPKDEDVFSADAALFTGETKQLLADLVEAMGGLLDAGSKAP
jgi:recombination associated protein RdgC